MLRNRFWGSAGRGSAAVGARALDGPSTAAGAGARSSAGASEALLLMENFERSCQGWFWSTDAEGRLTYLSDSVSRLLGRSGESPIGSRFVDIFVQADDDLSGRRTLPFVLARHSTFEKLALRPASGDTPRCWWVSGTPQFDRAERFTGYRGSALDITEQRRSSEHASQLARYDALTGLPNRRQMCDVLDASVVAAEHHARPCTVLLIDLDRFKQVNDTLGHPVGDGLLKHVAERLVRIAGDRERVFRVGGDEFQIILPNCDNRGIIGDLANDIIASLSQPYSIDGSRCIIGASIGVAVAPVDGRTRDELIRNADLALYASKSSGRGRFRFFCSDLLQAAEDKRMLEEDLRDALARGEFSLAYQPIVSARTNVMKGVEALLRWQHPVRGPISPALFIPIAEEAGLIEQIGNWVLRKACEDASGWPGKLRVAVNVSPIQFQNDAFPATVVSALSATGLAPDRLELEITEGVFLGEVAETDTMFSALKALGVRLALDDFGTGYSSLGYLRTAPFDKIKIDQTFVRAATLPQSRNSAIIAAIVALAEALNMETTAEGIEYMDQLKLVRALGVSHVQGWVYSKAVSAEEFARRLADGDWSIEPSGPARQRSTRQAMYRKVGVIHGNRYSNAVMRNLSESGALIEGMDGLQPDALIVVDFGDGQLAFARVMRSQGRQHGIAFEQQLVDDGNGGLCTSHRVSPYLLGTVGLPSPDQPEASGTDDHLPLEELAKKLGLTLAPRRGRGSESARSEQGALDADDSPSTFRQLSVRYLESLQGDEPTREKAKRDMRNHVLPRFGQLRLDQVTQADVFAWLAAKVEVEGHPAGTDGRLHALLSRMWGLAAELGWPGAEPNPLEGSGLFETRVERTPALSLPDALKLLDAARASHNRQLKFIVSLLLLTGARQGELLKAEWGQIDLEAGVWDLPSHDGTARELRLGPAAREVISRLPRWDDCSFLIANPNTRKPYRSILKSWDVAKTIAGLSHLEIDDLRYCEPFTRPQEEQILAATAQEAGASPVRA